MSHDDEAQFAERIAERGRAVVLERLRAAFAHQAAAHGRVVELDSARLERLVQTSAGRAGDALRRRSLAQALMEELAIDLPQALAHPVMAQTLGHAPGAVAFAAEPRFDGELEPDAGGALAPAIDTPQALRLSAVHLNGIETLRQGDRDIELRLSAAGLDVLKRSSGAAIGRLEWSEIEEAEVPPPRRGLRGRHRARTLHVRTERGQAQFELPGLTDEELHDHLEPTLARLRGADGRGQPATAANGGEADDR